MRNYRNGEEDTVPLPLPSPSRAYTCLRFGPCIMYVGPGPSADAGYHVGPLRRDHFAVYIREAEAKAP